MNPRTAEPPAAGSVPAVPADQTEASIAADVLVILLGDQFVPRRTEVLRNAREALGLTVADLREAMARQEAGRRTFDRTPLVPATDVDRRPVIDLEPVAAPEPPAPPAPPRRGTRPPRPAKSTRSAAAARLELTRGGFYLADGTYVSMLDATAAQHRERSAWMLGLTALAAGFAVFHDDCADLIEQQGVERLADLDADLHPTPPAVDITPIHKGRELTP